MAAGCNALIKLAEFEHHVATIALALATTPCEQNDAASTPLENAQ